jgi:hypothetical protein
MMALIAFSEEFVFRGYVLDNLMQSFPNKWVALVISSVLFAAFHFTSPEIYPLAFVNLFLAGLLLGANYIYTRNLWFSFFLHLSWNFFQGPILGFRVSGLVFPSLLVPETKGDLFITGGDFGLEGSILTTVTAFITLFLIIWAFERKYSIVTVPAATAPANPTAATRNAVPANPAAASANPAAATPGAASANPTATTNSAASGNRKTPKA